MNGAGADTTAFAVRDLIEEDLRAVTRIDGLHTGVPKPEYWRAVFDDFLRGDRRRSRVSLAVDGPEGLLGYLLGEVRAFEFGSEPCGWVFAVGVDPETVRRGVASCLLAEACKRFHDAGVERTRTMVERTNVPVLSFFRTNGFTAGRFVQLELALEETA
jgi:ribosomal protein S18 acetylase RimI-like enzyme